MSNYYHRDGEGNWFVKSGKGLSPVEFSASMEIAYTMGKIEALKKIREGMIENLMLVRNTQVGEVVNSSIQR